MLLYKRQFNRVLQPTVLLNILIIFMCLVTSRTFHRTFWPRLQRACRANVSRIQLLSQWFIYMWYG